MRALARRIIRSEKDRAVAEIVPHNNQRYYLSNCNDFALVLNRSHALYFHAGLEPLKSTFYKLLIVLSRT